MPLYESGAGATAMAKRKIRAKDIVSDIRAGLDDGGLMRKYRLTSKGLQRIFSKLLEGKFIVQTDLDNRYHSADDTADIDDLREFPRNYPALAVTVYEGNMGGCKGVVRDITERGIGVIGIDAKPDEVKSFLIDAGRLSDFETIQFDATCRWIKNDPEEGQCVAGFEITNISEENLHELREVIGGFTLTDDTLAMMLP
jgi:hypothetical protein